MTRHRRRGRSSVRCRLARFVPVALLAVLVASCQSLPLEQEPWIEVRTETFRLLSQVEEERAVEMAQNLERFQSVLKLLATRQDFQPRVPTTIVLLRASTYRQFGPRYSAGWFMPGQRANYALVQASGRQADPTGVLFHEYTHFMMNNDTGLTYPGWYSEGFAEVMRGTAVREKSIVVGGVLTDRLIALDDLRSFPLRRLLVEPPSGHSPITTAIYYAKAWHLVQYLTYGSGLGDRTRQLQDYLLRVHGGATPEQACQEAFGVGIDELEWELEVYLRKGRLGGFVLRRSVIPEPAEPAVRRLGADEVAGELGMAALMLGNAERAESLYRGMLALRPDSARAHFGLADALRLQKRKGEYEALYERGLELGAGEALSQLDYGEYVLDAAGAARIWQRGELATRARLHLRRAIELDPELPEAHAQLAASYLALAGEEDVAQGLPIIEQAHRLLGSDVEITYLLALGLFQAGRVDEARDVVALARSRSHAKVDEIEALSERVAAASSRSRSSARATEP